MERVCPTEFRKGPNRVSIVGLPLTISSEMPLTQKRQEKLALSGSTSGLRKQFRDAVMKRTAPISTNCVYAGNCTSGFKSKAMKSHRIVIQKGGGGFQAWKKEISFFL